MLPIKEEHRRILAYYERALEGHVHIRETLDVFFDVLRARAGGLGHPPRILELGSHAGVVTAWLLQRWPHASIVVHDDDDAMVEISRQRLAERNVKYTSGPLSEHNEIDLVVSVARHHHLGHDYLRELCHVMGPRTVYVLADELCPEYCVGDQRARIEAATTLRIVGGYLLTTEEEIRAFEETGMVPALARELEDLRRRALWRWYRYVVDVAVERGYFDVAVGELQSTHDDLITGSDAEHKFSPVVVERQFALAGFQQLSKRMVGPHDERAHQSMFVYEFSRTA